MKQVLVYATPEGFGLLVPVPKGTLWGGEGHFQKGRSYGRNIGRSAHNLLRAIGKLDGVSRVELKIAEVIDVSEETQRRQEDADRDHHLVVTLKRGFARKTVWRTVRGLFFDAYGGAFPVKPEITFSEDFCESTVLDVRTAMAVSSDARDNNDREVLVISTNSS